MEGQRSWLCNPTFHWYRAQCSFAKCFLLPYQSFSSKERYNIYTLHSHKRYFLPHFVPISRHFTSHFIINYGLSQQAYLQQYRRIHRARLGVLDIRPSNKTTTCVISSDVAILDRRLPGPHPELLQTDLVTSSAHVKWYRQSKGCRIGCSKHFTRPTVCHGNFNIIAIFGKRSRSLLKITMVRGNYLTRIAFTWLGFAIF